jgi:gamma-glutamyl-gamma-aminobutyrate hydrolase PuuD
VASNASEAATTVPVVIGLSTYVEQGRFGAWDEPAALVPDSYLQAVVRAGGCPVLLPPTPLASAPTAATLLSLVDGLVLTGGPDVDPARYGAPAHSQTDAPRRERDAFEIALCHEALRRDLPLLAICRGLQVLNVSLGGTLHQHLPDVLGNDNHRVALGQMAPNRVSLNPGSVVGAILGHETAGLCHHHQAVERLGEAVAAVGFAADGTVEAVEVRGRKFVVGVQWHPEDNPADDRLFTALVVAAARRPEARCSAEGGPPLEEPVS